MRPIFLVSPKAIDLFEKVSPIKIGGITLFFIVLSREELSEEVKNHETIHFWQYIELLVFGFLILYLGYWIKNLICGMPGDEAYMNIPFEKEAYDNMYDENYLKNRKPYAWTKYI